MSSVFQCSCCLVYFESRPKATDHLSSKRCSFPPEKPKRSSGKEPEIKRLTLVHPVLQLFRLSDKQIQKWTSSVQISNPLIKRGRKKKLSTLPEIKLESLKASEIEALVKDLYPSKPYSLANQQDSHSSRRSRRKLTTIPTTYGELDSDSDSEEIIRPTCRRKSKGSKDCEYRPNIDPETDDETEKPSNYKSILKTIRIRQKDRTFTEKQVQIDLSYHDRGRKINKQEVLVLKGTLSCRICLIDFDLPKEYFDHMKAEHLTKDNKYICPHCKLGFFPMRKFNKHMNQVYNPKSRLHIKRMTGPDGETIYKYKCDICPRKFEYLKKFELHKGVHERAMRKEKKFECPICHLKLSRIVGLQRHFVIHLENNPFQCKFSGCGAKFGSKYHLQQHVKLHSSREFFKCTHCSKDFVTPTVLKRHIRNLHSENATKTSKPRKRSLNVKNIEELAPQNQLRNIAQNPNPSEMSLPLRTKKLESEDPHEVRVELESVHFNDRDDVDDMDRDSRDADDDALEVTQNGQHSLRQIMLNDPVYKKILLEDPEGAKRVLPPNSFGCSSATFRKQEFKCGKCDWTGQMAYSLQLHLRNVHNEEDTLIPILPQVTETLSNDDAATDQTTLPNFSLICGTCGFHSTSSSDLSSHMKTHSHRKKYFCSICGLRFLTQAQKQMHMNRAHFSEKRFTCPNCPNQRFSSAESLSKHKRKHDPEYQKFLLEKSKCKQCGKQLRTESGFKQHMLAHSHAARVQCKLCDQICATNASLKRHIQYVHLKAHNPYKQRRSKLSNSTELDTNPTETSTNANGSESVLIEGDSGEPSAILGL